MSNHCPTCEQPVPPDQAKVIMNNDGLISAASLHAGLGPPLVASQSCTHYEIKLDGQVMEDVVAYDCNAGKLWRHQKDAKGHLVIRDGQVIIEQLKGEVTVALRG
jgi:hypothetical protein